MEKKKIYILFILTIIINIITFISMYYIKNKIQGITTELSVSDTNVKLLYTDNKSFGNNTYIIDYYYNNKNPKKLLVDIYNYDKVLQTRKEKITTLKMEQLVNIDKNIPMSLEQELKLIELLKENGINIGIETINKTNYLYVDYYEDYEEKAIVIFYNTQTNKQTYRIEYIPSVYYTFNDTSLKTKLNENKHWYIDNSTLYYYGDLTGKTSSEGEMPVYKYTFNEDKQIKSLYGYFSGELSGKKY